MEDNYTAFKGNVDISINDRSLFYNTSTIVNLVNGKLLILSLDPAKTINLFTFPLFGIVTSLAR